MIRCYGRRPSITRAVPDVWVNPIIFYCPDALGLLPIHLDGSTSNEALHQACDFTLDLTALILRAYVFYDVLKFEVFAVL